MKRLIPLLAIIAIVSSGCAAKRQGYAKASGHYRNMMASALSDPGWYDNYWKETDPQKRMALRNRLVEYCIWLVDNEFNAYVTKFSRNQTITDLTGDWASLAFSGASAVASPSQLFGAIATGIQGAHAAYSKDALDQQTRGAILLKMDALRQERLLAIYKSESLPDAQYSLIQGLIDVQLYVNAGTVHAALASISQDAAVQHQSSSESLKTLREKR
jgi:hypothetical protein